MVFPVNLTIKAFILNSGNTGTHILASSNVYVTYWAIKILLQVFTTLL